jgi:hypothetical protein
MSAPHATTLVDEYIARLRTVAGDNVDLTTDAGSRVQFADDAIELGVYPWVAVGPVDQPTGDYGGQASLGEWRVRGAFRVRGFAAAATVSSKAAVDAARLLGQDLVAHAQALHVAGASAWGQLVELTFRELEVFGGAPNQPLSAGEVLIEITYLTYLSEGY